MQLLQLSSILQKGGQFTAESHGQFSAESVVSFQRNVVVSISGISKGSKHSLTFAKLLTALAQQIPTDLTIASSKFPTGITGQLSPLFMAEMMGFPPNWIALPFQNGQSNL